MATDDESQIELISRLSVPRYATRLKPTVIPIAHWDDEPLYCLKVNDEWISHILGVMIALDQPDTWLGTADEIYAARQQVNEIMVAFMEQCDPMSNCCPEPLTRINSDGTMDVSYDGGMTWQPATTEDPRKTSPQFPPIDDGDGANKKCKAANRVVRQMKDQQEAWANQLGTGLSIAQLALAFAAAIVVFAFSLEGLAAILYPALFSLGAALVGTGTDAYNDKFTTDVWNTFLCKIYCNCGEDGQFTQSQFLEIRTELDAAGFDPVVALAFSSALNAWQVDGLNNAAKIPTSDNLDCSDCDCTGCGAAYGIFDTYGTIVDIGDGFITVQAVQDDRVGGGGYAAGISSPDIDSCCMVEFGDIISGTPPSSVHGWALCGETPNASAFNHTGLTSSGCWQMAVAFSSSGPFTIKFNLTPCE